MSINSLVQNYSIGGEKGMKAKILKGFKYGSVSDPQKMTAGNIVDMSSFSESNVKKWIELKWIEVVE